MTWARATLGAKGSFPAGWRANGDLTRLALATGVARILTRPIEQASHLLISAETQNVRYNLTGVATATTGFLLLAGNDPIAVSCVGDSISVFPVAAGAILQYLWVW